MKLTFFQLPNHLCSIWYCFKFPKKYSFNRPSIHPASIFNRLRLHGSHFTDQSHSFHKSRLISQCPAIELKVIEHITSRQHLVTVPKRSWTCPANYYYHVDTATLHPTSSNWFPWIGRCAKEERTDAASWTLDHLIVYDYSNSMTPTYLCLRLAMTRTVKIWNKKLTMMKRNIQHHR